MIISDAGNSGVDTEIESLHGPLIMERPLQHLRVLRAQYLRELERNELFVAWKTLEKAIEGLNANWRQASKTMTPSSR